jgi:hypothetical protein
MKRERCIECRLTSRDDPCRPTLMHVGRGQECDARMTVLVVVPLEKVSAVEASCFEAGEPVRVVWLILHRFELALGEWVVVGHPRERRQLFLPLDDNYSCRTPARVRLAAAD